MSGDASNEDLDERFEGLRRRAYELAQRGLFRSNAAVARESRRAARAEQRIVDYLHATFELMNHSSSRLEPEAQSAAAVELIAALEDEDHARTIQPDLPEAEYAATRAWMTACAYDNLAYATGYQKGLNSEGLHACINEGIEVCRRTGKLECITCFREYATDVYRAADDIDMALHFARLGESHQVVGRHDRRWVGASDQAKLHLLQGQIPAALDDVLRAWKLAGTYHSPRIAWWKSRLQLETLLLLLGRDDDPVALLGPAEMAEDGAEDPSALPPMDEYPELEYLAAQVNALRHLVGNQPDEAAAILEKYDRLLDHRGYLSEWFETRLQLIAARRFGGWTGEAIARLAEPLEERARAARDWLTLRRLALLVDEAASPIPLALLADPAADSSDGAASPDHPTPDDAEGRSPEEGKEMAEPSPLLQSLRILFERASELTDEDLDARRAGLIAEILAFDPTTVSHPQEAASLLFVAGCFVDERTDLASIWDWAVKVGDRYPDHPRVQSHLAALGGKILSFPDSSPAATVTQEDLARRHRRAIDIEPDEPGNFARAGAFYLDAGDLSEAERCLARGFRLDRTDSFFALKLAEIYQQSDRPRDALAVLDLCLREGSEDPAISWQAAVLASALGQWEPVLPYVDHYEAQLPGQPWACYYRAFALVKLDRPQEALAAAMEEGRRSPDRPFGWQPLAAVATAELGDLAGFRERLGVILKQPLSGVDYLTTRGQVGLLEQLRAASRKLPADDPLRTSLDDLLLATGLAADEFFEEFRQAGDAIEGVNFYECHVDQPLDDAWASSPGCLAGEVSWTGYSITWGVLARDEDEARRIALQWQGRCYPRAPRSCEVELGSSGYRDKVGVVWQGMREGRTD